MSEMKMQHTGLLHSHINQTKQYQISHKQQHIRYDCMCGVFSGLDISYHMKKKKKIRHVCEMNDERILPDDHHLHIKLVLFSLIFKKVNDTNCSASSYTLLQYRNSCCTQWMRCMIECIACHFHRTNVSITRAYDHSIAIALILQLIHWPIACYHPSTIYTTSRNFNDDFSHQFVFVFPCCSVNIFAVVCFFYFSFFSFHFGFFFSIHNIYYWYSVVLISCSLSCYFLIIYQNNKHFNTNWATLPIQENSDGENSARVLQWMGKIKAHWEFVRSWIICISITMYGCVYHIFVVIAVVVSLSDIIDWIILPLLWGFFVFCCCFFFAFIPIVNWTSALPLFHFYFNVITFFSSIKSNIRKIECHTAKCNYKRSVFFLQS